MTPKKSGRLGDLVTGLVAVIIALTGFRALATIPASILGSDLGPTFIPRVLLWVLGGMGASLSLSTAFRGRRRKLAVRQPGAERPPKTASLTVIGGTLWARFGLQFLMVTSAVLYLVLIPILGFFGASLSFSLVWVVSIRRVMENNARFYVLLALVEATIITTTLFILFDWLLKVPLP